MATSPLGILNQALAHVGKQPVDSLDSSDPLVAWFNESYAVVRDSVTIDASWTFAKRRFIVDAGVDENLDPPFEFNHAYSLGTREATRA